VTPRIILTHDPAAVSIDAGPEALCVRHPAYQAPRTAAGCLHVDWQEFEAEPRRWMDGRSLVVVVGLNRIITPGNRTREVFEVLYNLSRDVRKLSIDQTLFVAEPWRAWFHFGFVGAPYREYTYSYLAESHWRAHQDGVRSENPFSQEALARWGAGIVQTTYAHHFDISVEAVELPEETHAEYARLKAEAFDEEHTIAAIIKRLSAFAQEACPQRSIPTPARLFERRQHRIVKTELRVDEHLVGRLLTLADLTNTIAATFYRGSHAG